MAERGEKVKLTIDINEKYDGISITIHAKEWSNEIEEIVQKINQQVPKRMVGFKEDSSILLSPSEIDYVFAQNRKVYAHINKQNIEVNLKLYEIEKLFEMYGFSRFSKSVIGNLHQISRFELSFNGNLCVYFHSGSKEYVSRKYVNEIKNKLILGDD